MFITSAILGNRKMTVNSEDFVNDEFSVQSVVNDYHQPKNGLQSNKCVANHGFGKRSAVKFQTLLGLLICALHLLSTGDAGRSVLVVTEIVRISTDSEYTKLLAAEFSVVF